MTQEQLWVALGVALLYVLSVLLRLLADTINDHFRANTKKTTAKIESEAVDTQSKTETEKMGIAYMQQLMEDNKTLRLKETQNVIEITKLTEKILMREQTLQEVTKTREAQLATQSELKVEAIKKAASMETRALTAEGLLQDSQKAFASCMEASSECNKQQAVLLGQYNELHADIEARRNEWHDERNNWQILDSARQTEVQRARFVMRQINAALNDEQRLSLQRACAAKGFEYEQFVEVAGSLEMAELEDLRKKNTELEAIVSAFSLPPSSSTS